MRKLTIAAAASGVALAAVLAYVLLTPRKLGLATPRMVVVAGDVKADGARCRASQPLAIGATLRTGNMGSACFSLHASRVCMGADSEARLVSLDASAGVVEVVRGTVVVGSLGETVRLDAPGGSVTVSQGAATVEATGGDVVVRVLDGGADVTSASRPATHVTATAAIGLSDGKPRPAAPALENEEREVLVVAEDWQGSAGSTVEIKAMQGHIAIDDHDVGRAPASLLLREGTHTLVIRNGARDHARDLKRQTLDLSGGRNLVIDG